MRAPTLLSAGQAAVAPGLAALILLLPPTSALPWGLNAAGALALLLALGLPWAAPRAAALAAIGLSCWGGVQGLQVPAWALAPAVLLPLPWLRRGATTRWLGYTWATCALGLLTVWGVLSRSSWQPEATAMVSLVVGLGLGLTVAATLAPGLADALVRPPVARAGAWAMFAILGIAAGRGRAQQATGAQPIRPVWQHRLAILASCPAVAPRPACVAELEALARVGHRRAASALAAVALAAGAGPTRLRALCPRSGRATSLPPFWRPVAAHGERACRAVAAAWPEDGAAALQADPRSAAAGDLARLRGDLWLEAGVIPAAAAAYAVAIAAGDPFAAALARQAAVDRLRPDLVTELAPATAAGRVAAGDAAGGTSGSAAAAATAELDGGAWAEPERQGMQVTAGAWVSVYVPALARRAWFATHPRQSSFAAHWLVPVGAGAAPGIWLQLRAGASARITLTNIAGEAHSYGCAADDPAPLPAPLCRGAWAQAWLPRPAGRPLARVDFAGDLALASLVLAAGPGAHGP